MFGDIVFPKNNEEEFIVMAQKLGYSALYFIYEYKNINQIEHLQDKIIQLKHKTKFEIIMGLKVKPNEIMKAKKFSDVIICESSDKNRWMLEKTRKIILYNLEYQQRKDFIHHRNSGLNQILCKFAYVNNITIGISCSSLINSKKKLRLLMFGRISQNIKLCRKYKVSMIFASFAKNLYEMRSPFDIQSLAVTLGMPSIEAQKAVTFNPLK